MVRAASVHGVAGMARDIFNGIPVPRGHP